MADNRYYGQFGGQYVSESLMNTLKELETAFNDAMNDPEFIKEYMYYLKEYVGRENPLYYAEKLSKKYGAKIYLKREDLNHTGAHKINNVIGQILLAKRMGKQVQDSTELQQQPEQHFSVWNVQYIWVLRILKDRHLMYLKWSF